MGDALGAAGDAADEAPAGLEERVAAFVDAAQHGEEPVLHAFVATSRFYRSRFAWRRRSPSSRAVDDAVTIDVMRQLRQHNSRGLQRPTVLYGHRKMTAWLTCNGFPDDSKHTSDRLMRTEGMPASSAAAR